MRQWLLVFCFFPVMVSGQNLPWPAVSPFSDSYGYTWKTSSAPDGPQFEWVNITQVGDQVIGLGDDNTVGPIDMGMDFGFYWGSYRELWVGDNGYISFSSGVPVASSVTGFPLIPTHDETDNIIAPFMADMNANGSTNPAEVYTWLDSVNERFIISWVNMPFFSTNSLGFAGSNTFQIILNKADSTITFQYLELLGNWDPLYNQMPYPFMVGIENLSGNMGLMPAGIPVDASVRPVDSTAIRFYPPETPKILIADVEVSWVGNEADGGIFLPYGPSANPPGHPLVAQVTNSGLVDIESTVLVSATVKDPGKNNEVLYADTLPIAGLLVAESRYLVFNKWFKPPRGGNFSLEVAIANPVEYGDLNTPNDLRTLELAVVDTTEDEVAFSFAQFVPGSLLFVQGFSGGGVFFEPFGFPVEIEALEFYVFPNGNPTTGFRAQLFRANAAGGQVPGQILFQIDMPAAVLTSGGGWVRVNMPVPFQVDSVGFYAGFVQLTPSVSLLTEENLPVSRRSYDIINGEWVVSRNNSFREPLIRAIVKVDDAIQTVGLETLTLENQLEVFPNPATDRFTLETSLSKPQPVLIRIISPTGQTIWARELPAMVEVSETIEVKDISAGVYYVELRTPDAVSTKMIEVK